MIDAASFSGWYNAFWNDCAPTCEHFVRRLNLDGLERFCPPMAKSGASNRALIAEYAFSLFVERRRDNVANRTQSSNEALEDAAWAATRKRLAPYVSQGFDLNRGFDEESLREVGEIARRLFGFFAKRKCQLVMRPVFTGCGYVDASEGDIIFGETIYEIKTVERPFRGIDIRQAIMYSALNFASKQFDIKNLGLLNPRRGQYCDVPLDHVCFEISGRPTEELLATIIEAISSSEISR